MKVSVNGKIYNSDEDIIIIEVDEFLKNFAMNQPFKRNKVVSYASFPKNFGEKAGEIANAISEFDKAI